jgi:hypothetical protein
MSEEEKTAKTEPKKARAKKNPPPKEKGPVYVITDLEEWERLLRDVPLKSGEIRFYRGKAFGVAFT